ncbi:MAG TPA: hypothetical protein VIO64_00940 [Pseudobacteroides sp.]|uniref:hypothetical protein n=1 Tax=Pseudobacteroides sp. TaxID=1968840 RepID=UPI002F93E796
MDNYSIAVFKNDNLQEEKSIKNAFLKMIKKFRGHDKPNWFQKVELCDGLIINLIKIPYSIEKYRSLNLKKREKVLRGAMEIGCANGVKYSILPFASEGDMGGENFYKRTYSGQILYRALLTSIINKICTTKKLDASSIDITIIHGNDKRELMSVVKLLSSFIKFITIITRDECIKKDTEEIYYETGTSIVVSGDYSNALKRSDIVINMGDIEEFKCFLREKSIILNYGRTADVYKKVWVINDIKVSLPPSITSNLDESLLEMYKVNELAEIFILSKAGLINIGDGEKCDLDFINKVESVFKKDGYTLEGFE